VDETPPMENAPADYPGVEKSPAFSKLTAHLAAPRRLVEAG
jgi:hypothetical protein